METRVPEERRNEKLTKCMRLSQRNYEDLDVLANILQLRRNDVITLLINSVKQIQLIPGLVIYNTLADNLAEYCNAPTAIDSYYLMEDVD